DAEARVPRVVPVVALDDVVLRGGDAIGLRRAHLRRSAPRLLPRACVHLSHRVAHVRCHGTLGRVARAHGGRRVGPDEPGDLLVASRARTVEGASGLMNLVMLPMWVFSGVFFSASNFPKTMQPFIQALPL